MSKNVKRIIIVLVIILGTNALTYGISSNLLVQTGDKVVISKSDFEELKSVYEDNKKIKYVEEIIDKEFYQEPDKDKYLDGQIKGLVASLGDPYSQYLTKKEYKSLTEEMSGSFGGIGVIVSPGTDNMITVVSPIEGTPGEKAGLKPEDKIIKVNGEEFLGEDMDKAVEVMKGEPGTDVTLTIMRRKSDGSNDIFDVDITREVIRVDSVKHEMLDDKLGYIKLTSFDELTHDEFKNSLKDLEKNGVEGLILDLRNNPGGRLDVCAEITDELIGEGDIVYTENRDGEREYLKSKSSKIDYPLVILVNEGSASASEILAGAVKDHEEGILIGETTFGKGLVQRIMQLPDKSGVKITISEYFTPNGTKINGEGVEPDYKVELPEDIEGIGIDYIEKDTQLQKAIEVLKDEI